MNKIMRGRCMPIRMVERAAIVLLSAEGLDNQEIGKRLGISKSTVGRIWRAKGLKPHLTSVFKLSNDKHFVEKLEDIAGLYLSPPEHAVVLSCDEKSRIQALDRTPSSLPLKKGRCGTMTHDDKRNGTTSLFAALNVADGSIVRICMKRHRHQEWIRFLNLIKRSIPKAKGDTPDL